MDWCGTERQLRIGEEGTELVGMVGRRSAATDVGLGEKWIGMVRQ